jgi:RNA polymerase sigma-70 factor (ECF subfamily)
MTEQGNEMARKLAAAAPAVAAKVAGHEDELDAALRARWDEARAAWPALAVSIDAWIAAIAAGLADATAPVARVGELHAADLYLAQACAAGDGRALVAFEDECRDTVNGSLRAMGLADDVIADVAQDVRAKLLAGSAPRIGTYTGRASLKTWTRTVATRAAVSRLRKKPAAHVDDEVLAALPAPDDGPDEQHFRAKYKVELKAAFEEAMASLTPQQRNVLRHHYVDSLSIDEIGALYGVHRTTAFRWLETARGTLAKRTQAGFGKRVRASPSEMQSIVRLLQSNIELSLQRVLGADET